MYLDNSATTAVSEEVLNEMEPYFREAYGNPSTLYSVGREAKKGLDKARQRVADAINADPKEIIFTSGGSESDNLAIKGIALKLKGKGNHIITSEIEHPAVKETLHFLETLDFKVTYLPVYEILFHTDAVQTFGKVKVDVEELNVDLLSLSSHKVHGPKGVGALYIKKGVRITPLIHGGGQERGIRSGTENVPGIVGFGKACEIANNNLEENYARLVKTRDEIIEKVLDAVPKSYLNGDRNERLPNVINFRFSSIEGESLILLLDAKGYQASTGSACSSKTLEASPVLKALNLDDVDVHGSLRISLGSQTHFDDVDGLVEAIKESVATLRKMSPLWNSDEKYEEMMGQSK